MNRDLDNVIEEAMRLGRLQVERDLTRYPVASRSADIADLRDSAAALVSATPKSYAEMQQRAQRQQHAAAHLQTAHNRALRRLRKASSDLADLRRTVEEFGVRGSALHLAYLRWCAVAGVPTPDDRAARRRAAVVAELVQRIFVCDGDGAVVVGRKPVESPFRVLASRVSAPRVIVPGGPGDHPGRWE